MESTLQEKLEQAVWVAHSLFDRGRTSGSSANMSFLHQGNVYITASGTCFGRLTENDFAVLDANGKNLSAKRASKEYPLHRDYYKKNPAIQCVIHTHGPWAVLWSCRAFDRQEDIIPRYTPYLEMKVGKIALVPYAPPGSPELFSAFQASVSKGDAFLLKNHGGIMGGTSILEAFYGIEELEESARVACMIERNGIYEKIY